MIAVEAFAEALKLNTNHLQDIRLSSKAKSMLSLLTYEFGACDPMKAMTAEAHRDAIVELGYAALVEHLASPQREQILEGIWASNVGKSWEIHGLEQLLSGNRARSWDICSLVELYSLFAEVEANIAKELRSLFIPYRVHWDRDGTLMEDITRHGFANDVLMIIPLKHNCHIVAVAEIRARDFRQSYRVDDIWSRLARETMIQSYREELGRIDTPAKRAWLEQQIRSLEGQRRVHWVVGGE
ncbi:hypothetical protein AJ80_09767 [Polytolypa hystricis UAMH7299]|uniref:Uncharacterized protein n=1 Tax=Polytolypa hystricis (strain UAMH7299) TaxID=1447883 RepID=A0A2B7WK46_POLH7|nr:hypothetical protein AJ80_09767 [Polytolypa hystricis UAMH7299]